MGRTVLWGMVSLVLGLVLFALSWWTFLAAHLFPRIWTWWFPLFIVGAALCTLFFFLWSFDLYLRKKKDPRPDYAMHKPIKNAKALVCLIAYNEEASVATVVKEFLTQSTVSRVIVIDNNSKDRTGAFAKKAGATVVVEKRPGYGAACLRALQEGAARAKANEVVVLCECDHTFFADDVQKFLAYIENADMVVGTRMVPELVDKRTQLNAFFEYGNYFVGKLIHVKYYLRFTDVGCTYRAIRPVALKRLLPKLTQIGHTFSPHMITRAADMGLTLVEIPIAFRVRIGVSKGANGNLWLGVKTGLKMMWDVLVD